MAVLAVVQEVADFVAVHEDLVAQPSDGINQDLPIMVGKETQMDPTTAGPGNRLIFNYTLVNYREPYRY